MGIRAYKSRGTEDSPAAFRLDDAFEFVVSRAGQEYDAIEFDREEMEALLAALDEGSPAYGVAKQILSDMEGDYLVTYICQ